MNNYSQKVISVIGYGGMITASSQVTVKYNILYIEYENLHFKHANII